jgi:Tfp pilus assembly protein PilF
VVAAIVIAGATLVYQRFFAPSPETILLMDTLNLVDRSVMEQDWASASQAVDSVLPTLPADVELLIWRAVLAERMGKPAAAAAFLAQARALEVDSARLGIMLGMKRLLAGDLDGAAAAAADARQADPSSSEAVFILASVAEASGDRVQAITLFEEAAALAEENNPQMAVTSRMRLAALLQQGPAMFEPQATESAP